ncbi:MAG: dNTP triphosphohydrolase [Verrucomicrobia bacterium]|nr:dNTP triphosphohydrolase [Verrucomicrobiota bacterium]
MTPFQPNAFYGPFDVASPEPRDADDYRTPFQTDRDRIIYSSAFRRLQAKTQVFLSGEFDFYRTRLTHSLEVAQIGRSICGFLRQTSSLLTTDFYVDPDLVEAVCLTHDLGHSPFGHAGERTLHHLMRPHGGFEGNAQSLRIITETIYPGITARRGMNPTRAFADGILKYKRFFGDDPSAEHHFLYDEQARFRDFVFPGMDLGTIPDLNRFRSLECEIMDWADDTAYCLNDLVDSINAGFLRFERVERWASEQNLTGDAAAHATTVLSAIKDRKAEPRFGKKIGCFIRATSMRERQNPMASLTNRYRFGLSIDPAVRAEADLYKRISQDLVFDHSQLHQLERKGRVILEGIFRAFADMYLGNSEPALRLLPESFDRLVREQTTDRIRARIVCDYLAGMTDGFAVRTYKRLFDPEFGSILDLG